MLDKNEWIRPWAGSDDEVTKMLDIKLIRENPDKIKAGLKEIGRASCRERV